MDNNIDVSTATEQELREFKVPWFNTIEELNEFIEKLANREHDYGTCVYAMSMSAVAAFYYIAHKLGVTGFQASCADLDVIRRTRHWNFGFMILNADDLLYPQYDLREKVEEWIKETQPKLAPRAKELLQDRQHAHPAVIARWEEIAKLSEENGI